MHLFAPEFLICPICNPDPGQRTGYEVRSFRDLGGRRYRGTITTRCEHEFSLYESVRQSIRGGLFGVVGAFAHDQWHSVSPITPGDFINISLPTIADHQPFAALATSYAVPFQSNITITESNSVAIATTRMRVDAKFDGEPSLGLVVYFRRNLGDEAWATLLYESINDYLHRRHWLSIFKLATSIEIFADRLYERYLVERANVDQNVAATILRGARSWNDRFRRMADVIKIILPAQAIDRYRSSSRLFTRDVREPRNEFAHGIGSGWAYEEASRAYVAAFDVLWTFDELNEAL